MITGIKQSFAGQTGYFGFQFDITAANTSQQINAGVSGLHLLNFTFLNGKIYDPNNYYVGCYQQGLKVTISGQVGANSFDYYINNNLIALQQPKQTGYFDNFFVTTNNTGNVGFNAFIAGTIPNYTLENNIIFIPGQLATGSINNLETFNHFKLFSGITFSSNINYSGNTLGSINPGGSGLYYLYIPGAIQTASYFFPLNLYTDFGNVLYNLTLNAGLSGGGEFTNLNIFTSNFNGISGVTGTTNSNNGSVAYYSISGVSYVNTPYLDIYLLTTGSGWDLSTGINSNGYGSIDFIQAGFIGTSGLKNPFPQTGLAAGSIYITVNYTSNTGHDQQYSTLVVTGMNTGYFITILGTNI